jgi:cell division protein FtsQ
MKTGNIREERKRKKKRKAKLIAFLVILLLLAAAALVVVKVFVVENVEVEGNVLYGDDVISETVLNDKYSWNSLYVYFKYRFLDTEEVPFIDTMEVTLKSPRTLHITVYEKGIMGYLYDETLGENVYFDKDGIVVETSADVIENTPEIEGIACEDVVLYEKLPIKKAALKDILTLTQTLKRNELVPDAIIYGRDDSPILVYGNVWIQLGSDELLTQKVARIAKILPSLDGMSGVLHMESWTEETTNIVFDRDE